jgi:hypothetical protein
MFKHSRTYLLTVLACGQLLTACAYQQLSQTPSAVQAAVSVGDTVRVTTQNGDRQVFRVTQVTESGLSGEADQFTYAQMTQLERQSTNQAVIWIVVGLGVAAAASGSSGSSY